MFCNNENVQIFKLSDLEIYEKHVGLICILDNFNITPNWVIELFTNPGCPTKGDKRVKSNNSLIFQSLVLFFGKYKLQTYAFLLVNPHVP